MKNKLEVLEPLKPEPENAEKEDPLTRRQDARERILSGDPRILFFQCAFAFLDAADTTSVIGKIKAALRAPDAHLEWTIQPVLDHLRSRLGERNYQFLRALAEALNDPKAMPHLDEYPLWRNAAAAATSD